MNHKQPAAQQGMKTFTIIWLGQLISIIGSGMTSFGLGVWIFDQTKQATPFALTVLCGSLPGILLSPLAGSLADRWNRKALMILADCANALLTVLVLLLYAGGMLAVWHIYLVAALGSICAAFQQPAFSASVTMLVPKAQLARASGMVQGAEALGSLISPLLAGVLFMAIGLNGIFLIDFVTFFFAVGTMLLVKIPQPELSTAEREQKSSVWRDARFGWNYLRARPGLFGLLWYFALVNFLLNFATVLSAPLVLSFGDAGQLGLVQMISGIGMLGGSVLLSIWGGPKGRKVGVVLALIAVAATGLVVIGLRPLFIFPAVGMFILLFAIPLASGSSQPIFQTRVAPEAQGRVFAIRGMISRSMMPVAFLLAGPLADLVFGPLMVEGGALANTFLGGLLGVGLGRGIGLIFILSGLLLLVVTALAWANPRIRNVEEELPELLTEKA